MRAASAALVFWREREGGQLTMRTGQVILGVGAVFVAVLHGVYRRPLAAIVPQYLPGHGNLVVISGALAAVGGVGLLIPATQQIAAWGLVLWLVAVFPANVSMAQHPELYTVAPEWLLWARLPLQLPLIWWAWRYTRAPSGLSGSIVES